MAIRQIRLDSDPILKKKSREVENIDDKILTLLDDMVETLDVAQGVGLAAPQVGILKRVIIVNVDECYKMINPEILETSEPELGSEGCLSVPGYVGMVTRPKKVKAKFTDETGKERIIEAEGLEARCICHEIDHLNGILYTDLTEEVYTLEELENLEKDE